MLSWGGAGADTEPLTPLGRFLARWFPPPEQVTEPSRLSGFGCEREAGE